MTNRVQGRAQEWLDAHEPGDRYVETLRKLADLGCVAVGSVVQGERLNPADLDLIYRAGDGDVVGAVRASGLGRAALPAPRLRQAGVNPSIKAYMIVLYHDGHQ